MSERGNHSPELERERIVERAATSLLELLRSVESGGRRVLRVLGPAAVLGSPAFASEPIRPVSVANTADVQCDVAWISVNGDTVGQSTVRLPDAGSSLQSGTIEVRADQVGDRGDAAPVGLLSEPAASKSTAKSKLTSQEQKSLLDTARLTIGYVQDHAYQGTLMGGDAYGWKFDLHTDGSANPVLASHDVSVTMALVLDKDFSVRKLAHGKEPEVDAVFARVTFKPKR